MTARSRPSVEYLAEEGEAVGLWWIRELRNSAF